MNFQNRVYESERKLSQRSILKNNNSKQLMSTGKKQMSTAIGHSVKFREPKQDDEVKEFREVSTQKKEFIIQASKKDDEGYSHSNLMRDVNYINNLYNHVLVMISIHCKKQQNSEGKVSSQVIRMAAQIQRIIGDNLSIKEQIDQRYKSMMNLHELADYLNKTPQELQRNSAILHEFIDDFNQKEDELQRLEDELAKTKKISKSGKTIDPHQIAAREQRCKEYRKVIERQEKKIAKLEQEQKILLKNLYTTQKDILKKERSTSVLKLKINQIEGEEEYKRIRAKTKDKPSNAFPSSMNKQNTSTVNKEKKNIKIETLQKIKSKVSLAKLIKRYNM